MGEDSLCSITHVTNNGMTEYVYQSVPFFSDDHAITTTILLISFLRNLNKPSRTSTETRGRQWSTKDVIAILRDRHSCLPLSLKIYFTAITYQNSKMVGERADAGSPYFLWNNRAKRHVHCRAKYLRLSPSQILHYTWYYSYHTHF